jgi:hypothetical protein
LRTVLRRLILLAPLALIGCGGGHSDPVAKADAVCRDVNTKLRALGQPTTPTEVRRYVSKSIAIERDGLKRLRAANVPKAGPYEKVIEKLIELSAQVGDAVISGNAARQQRLTSESAALGPLAKATARQAGLEDCSK